MTEATLLAGFGERAAELDGSRLLYRVGGDGPAVVLVHGLGGAATNWSSLARLLAEHYRVLVPNLPGHGGSDPLQSVDGLNPFADAVAACLRCEGIRRAAIVGHSLGGAVAVRLALRRPDVVSALVLAAGAGISSGTLRARAGLRVLGVLRPSRLAARFRHRVAGSPSLKRACFGLLTSDPESLSEEAVLGFLAGAATVTDAGTAGAALFQEDARAELHELACPVLVLWGARDWFLPLTDGHEFARRLGAPLRVLPDTGHLLIGERPEACAGLIARWLDGVGQVEELPLEVEALGQRAR